MIFTKKHTASIEQTTIATMIANAFEMTIGLTVSDGIPQSQYVGF